MFSKINYVGQGQEKHVGNGVGVFGEWDLQ